MTSNHQLKPFNELCVDLVNAFSEMMVDADQDEEMLDEVESCFALCNMREQEIYKEMLCELVTTLVFEIWRERSDDG